MQTAALILYAVCLFGCKASAVPPSFPAATQVSRLSISSGKVITEQSKIAELSARLEKNKSGRGYTSHTYPTPQAQIIFVGLTGQAFCRLDIGPNLVGTNCGVELKSNWPPLVLVSKEQALFFRSFVAGTWEVK